MLAHIVLIGLLPSSVAAVADLPEVVIAPEDVMVRSSMLVASSQQQINTQRYGSPIRTSNPTLAPNPPSHFDSPLEEEESAASSAHSQAATYREHLEMLQKQKELEQQEFESLQSSSEAVVEEQVIPVPTPAPTSRIPIPKSPTWSPSIQIEDVKEEAQDAFVLGQEKPIELVIDGEAVRRAPKAGIDAILQNANIRSGNDLQEYAEALVQSNDAISQLTIGDNAVTITHTRDSHLFGFIPVAYDLTITVDDLGMVEVRKPWWLFLAADDSAEVQAELEQQVLHEELVQQSPLQGYGMMLKALWQLLQ